MKFIRNFRRRAGGRLAMWVQEHCSWLPDKLFLWLIFWLKMGHVLNLKSPRTFSEKIQWLKLYNRRPEYTRLVDKLAVKSYVAEIVGMEYVIPTLGVWDKPEDIEWNKLPDQFVLKTTHGGGSGGVVVCTNKSSLDKDSVIFKLKQSLEQDIYESFREWPYKDVPRRIIAEEYIEPAPGVQDLPDYKWYCFGGEPKFCQVIQDRHRGETIDFFDTEWNHQPFIGLNPAAKHATILPQRPIGLDIHLMLAKELSKNLPFARVDLYTVGTKTYFGEITFYPGSGLGEFYPSQYNEVLGNMLILPPKYC